MKPHFILLIICIIIFFSCPPTEFFSEYDGTNLISDVSMSQWDPDQNTTYMNYVSTGYAPPKGSGGVYRLEIINLMPNGDFELALSGAWSVVNGGGAVDTLEATIDAYSISGNTLHFATDDPRDRIDFDLRNAIDGITDGFIEDCSYTVKYNYRANPSIIFSYHDDDGTDDIGEFHWKVWGGVNGSTTNPSFNNIVEFPPSNIYGNFPEMTVGADLNHYFSFGSLDSDLIKSQEGYIDNYKVIRTDIPLRLRLAIDSDDTTEPLISGSYRFSVYVKLDPAAGTNNRFASTKVCLRISGGNNSKYGSFSHGTDGNWSNWQKLSVDVFIQFPSGDKEIKLSICPADDAYGALFMDAGSILISQPSLEFFAEGF